MVENFSIIIFITCLIVLTKDYFFVNILVFLARFLYEKEISNHIFNDIYVLGNAFCMQRN